MPYNLGLEGYVGIVLYLSMWVAFFFSIFRDPVFGLYYLTPLIPIQTVRYRLNGYPLGGSVVTIIMIGMTIGLLRRSQSPLSKTPWNFLLILYFVYTLGSVLQGTFYLNEPVGDFFFSERFSEWRDYITMIALLFYSAATVRSRKSLLIMLGLMCFSGFLLNKSFWGTVSGRDFSSYSDDLREEGGMGYAGVNGLAGFEAEFATFMIVMASFDRSFLRKVGYLSLGGFSALCLMYSLSRAGYVAIVAGLLFVGLFKNRLLLVGMVLFGLSWTALVPNAVRERVLMTNSGGGELDHSSETRVQLWEEAMQIFESSPIVGTGFMTYAYMQHVGNYRDSHNIFVKILVETGVVGIIFFLCLLGMLWAKGLQLWRQAVDPLYAGLGFGLAAWISCAFVANMFGDRWTFLQVNGFLWILAGLVARATYLNHEAIAAMQAPLPEPDVVPALVNA